MGAPLYCLKTDFSKYFASIDRPRLHEIIRRKISCRRTLQLIETMTHPVGVGLPIGSLTSQLFANLYGGAVDRFIHFDLGEQHWHRYMDDIVILGHDPERLRAVRCEIEQFASEYLRLRFSRWSVAPVTRGVNFLGYRIWPTHKLLRRRSVISAKRKIARFRASGDNEALEKFLAAWTGHAGWADVHNLFSSLNLKPENSNDADQHTR